MIYDPAGHRMILFGGAGASYYDDTWALSLGSSPSWTLLSPGGTTPSERLMPSFVFDSQRGRGVMQDGYGYSTNEFGASSYGPLDDHNALDLGGSLSWSPVVPLGGSPGWRWGHTTVYDAGLDRIVLHGGGEAGDTWLLSFLDALAPTPASLVEASSTPSGIQLEWQGREPSAPSATLYRKPTGGGWQSLGTVVPDAQNRLIHEDATAQAGTGYDYLLGFKAAVGDVYSEPAHVDPQTVGVPAGDARFAIHSAEFRSDALVVSFSLPGAEPARLALFDVAGRRVASQVLAGVSSVARVDCRHMASGIYWVRLDQAGASRVARAARIR